MLTTCVQLLIVPLLAAAPAKEPGHILLQANTAYESGDYAEATRLYTDLIAEGFDGGHVYYNLGNAELRGGHLGRAVAAYRRALALRPRDADVRANLDFARKSAKDAIAPPGPSAVTSTLFFWHYSLSRRELLYALLAANLLFWGVLSLRLLRRRSELLRWLAALSLVVLVAVGASYAVRVLLPQRTAVMVAHEVDVHAGTSRDTVVRFKLHEGAEARVLESRGEWIRLVLPNGEQGWVSSEDATVVES